MPNHDDIPAGGEPPAPLRPHTLLRAGLIVAALLALLLGWYHVVLRTSISGTPLTLPTAAPDSLVAPTAGSTASDGRERDASSAAVPLRTGRIALVPLDSRPPCRDLVVASGRLTDREVIVPPGEIMDYYSQPGDTQGLRDWLAASLSADTAAAIISIDQLLYGGLLAAREHSASPDDIAALADYLRALHTAHPSVPLYAFSILPRLTPQDGIDGYAERRDLVAYSRLAGRDYAAAHGTLAAGDEPLTDAEHAHLVELEGRIPPTSLARYLAHFAENEALNRMLIDLAREGVLHRLVLGQDDGEPYSIPNIEKEHLKAYMQAEPARAATPAADEAPAVAPASPAGRVYLTHGADEVGLLLLAALENEALDCTPRVALRYADAGAAARVMPYMAISNEECAREKIALLGGETVPEDSADFLLYINAGDNKDHAHSSMTRRGPAVQELSDHLQQAAEPPVALVDLSVHFAAQETLLPLLIGSHAPLHDLLAYAGWNTASNAIGTALAQASLSTAAARTAQSAAAAEPQPGSAEATPALARLASVRTALLDARMLEDYYYLKADIDLVNRRLKKAGYTNTADLDLEHNHRWANAMLEQTMHQQIASLKATRAYRAPFALTPGAASAAHLQAYDLTATMGYPWPRTFEISLTATPYLAW